MSGNLYVPLLRPASSFTLPPGLGWEYTEAPWSIAHRRQDLPRSVYEYGVIKTERPLTEYEVLHFDLQELRC